MTIVYHCMTILAPKDCSQNVKDSYKCFNIFLLFSLMMKYFSSTFFRCWFEWWIDFSRERIVFVCHFKITCYFLFCKLRSFIHVDINSKLLLKTILNSIYFCNTSVHYNVPNFFVAYSSSHSALDGIPFRIGSSFTQKHKVL